MLTFASFAQTTTTTTNLDLSFEFEHFAQIFEIFAVNHNAAEARKVLAAIFVKADQCAAILTSTR